MRLKKYNIKKVNKDIHTKTRNLMCIEEFVESGMDCAMVEDYPHKNAKSCAAALQNTIRIFHVSGIRAIERKGNVFLVRDISRK